MQINELNVYSVDGSALGKSPPIWTPAADCFLLSRADNPKTKCLVNDEFTRFFFIKSLRRGPLQENETVVVTISFLLVVVASFSDPPGLLRRPLAVRRGLEPLTPCVTGTYSNQLN